MKTNSDKPAKPAAKTKKPAKPAIKKVEAELSPEDLKEVSGGVSLITERNPS
jgi:hypothetical protein